MTVTVLDHALLGRRYWTSDRQAAGAPGSGGTPRRQPSFSFL